MQVEANNSKPPSFGVTTSLKESEVKEKKEVLYTFESSFIKVDTSLSAWKGYAEQDYFLKHHSFLLQTFGVVKESQGQGEGTRAFKEVFQCSLALGLDGHVHIDACYSSHLFWLKMGFIPYLSEVGKNDNYYYSNLGLDVNKDLEEIESFENEYPTFGAAAYILHNEQFAYVHNIKRATKKVLLENKQFLKDIGAEKGGKAIRYKFIPSLLNVIKSSIKKPKERPDSSRLGPVAMFLTDEGRVRWKKAIEDNNTIELFRDCVLLKPYMTELQKKALEIINNNLKQLHS